MLRRDAPWLADLVAELTVFPNGRHDDQVDALTKTTQMLDRMRGTAGGPDLPASNPFMAKNAFSRPRSGTRL